MNLVRNKTLHPNMRDDEVLVVENAIRLAIDSIINVLYGVNSARTHEYQRMVADRDKEIQRLERRLGQVEHELQGLRRHGCTSRLVEKEQSLVTGSLSSEEPQEGGLSAFEQRCMDTETTTGQQECEMSLSLGLFARPSSHVSSQSQESALPSSPSRHGLEQTCTPYSSNSSGVSEAARNLPTSPSSVVVKEEPCDMDAVLIKLEMSEERITEIPESTSSLCQEQESPSVTKKLESREQNNSKEKPHTDLDGDKVTQEGQHRNKKRNVPMSELPEEVQKLKRAAWRAASRRYYARKVARQQANPLHAAPYLQMTDSHFTQPISFVQRRRKVLTSELPVGSQTHQREAWRGVSKRHYSRKTARHQTDQSQFMLLNTDPSGETQGPNNGGIMCS